MLPRGQTPIELRTEGTSAWIMHARYPYFVNSYMNIMAQTQEIRDDQVNYRNVSLISRFISEQGNILSRRMNKLTFANCRVYT